MHSGAAVAVTAALHPDPSASEKGLTAAVLLLFCSQQIIHYGVTMLKNRLTGLLLTVACLQFVTAALAQRNRIVGPINNSQRVALTDHIHPRASAANDHGRASASFVLPYLTVMLKQTPAQLADLNQFSPTSRTPAPRIITSG